VKRVFRQAMRSGGGFDRYGTEDVDLYEREFARAHGVKYATAVSSGTAAVHTALSALRMPPGKEIICNTITDPGAVAPILWNNCIPVFAEHELHTFQISARTIEPLICRHTGAIIVGHIAGIPAHMVPIMRLAKRHGIPVIEDAAQAHGALYRGRPVGGLADLAAFSLMSGKHTTAGGQGGMVLTDDEELYWNAKRFADRGKPFGSDCPTILMLGNNYRMTQLQAAIGRAQLRKMRRIAHRRHQLVGALRTALAGSRCFRVIWPRYKCRPAWWFVFIAYDGPWAKQDACEAVRAEGIPVALEYRHVIYEHRWIAERAAFEGSEWPWSQLPKLPHLDPASYTDGSIEAVVERYCRVGVSEFWTADDARDVARAMLKVERAMLGS
jgi:dTDP-4-amino-4,6-dideoxygalactose transaminase